MDFALPYLRDYLRKHTVTDAAGRLAPLSALPPPPDMEDVT
ncbi:hypothetical protein [Microbacterium aoyamense]|nr:hypothetical protein [Microbacterium aoyamense]